MIYHIIFILSRFIKNPSNSVRSILVTMPIYFACLKSIKDSQMCISKAYRFRHCILDVSGDQFLMYLLSHIMVLIKLINIPWKIGNTN